MDVTLIQSIADAPTGSVGVSLDANGKPTFAIHEGSAWDRIAWTPELETRIAEADAVYFGTLGQRNELSRATIRRALDMAKASGVIRIVDVNLRPPFHDDVMIRKSIELASVLKLSDDELAQVAAACDVELLDQAEQTLRALLDRFRLDLVVMTRGAEGALLVSPDESVDQPGIPTQVRDTVGAGDAFTATLVAGLLRAEPLRSLARAACERAAAVCAHTGAVPDLSASSEESPNG